MGCACHGHTPGWHEVPYHSWYWGETCYRLSPDSGCFACDHMFPTFPEHTEVCRAAQRPGMAWAWKLARGTVLCQSPSQHGKMKSWAWMRTSRGFGVAPWRGGPQKGGGAAAKPGQQQVPHVSTSTLLWGSFPLALLSLLVAPALAGPCGVPQGQGQDELWLC